MNREGSNRFLHAASLYRLATRLHGALPYHLSPWGHAFPALHYFLEVTRRCNLRCAMCQYTRWFDETPPKRQAEGELTTAEWKNVIDQTGRVSVITFTGGEPFLRDDFVEILEHASRKRRTHFISNGFRISDDIARQCVALAPDKPGRVGLNFAGFSLHGTRDVHNALCGRDDAFDKTVNAIQAIARHRSTTHKRCPFVHVTAVLQDANCDALPELPPILAENGVECLNLALEIRLHDVPGVGDVEPDTLSCAAVNAPRIDAMRLVECISKTRTAAEQAGIELRLPRMPLDEIARYYSGGAPQGEHDVRELARFECRSAWSNLYIGANGNVYPCFIQKVGNIRQHSLSAIWNSRDMRRFRMRLREGGPFQICDGCCELEYRGGRCATPPE